MIPSVTALIVSCQVILGTFFLSILGIKHTRHPVTAATAPSQDSRSRAALSRAARSWTALPGRVG